MSHRRVVLTVVASVACVSPSVLHAEAFPVAVPSATTASPTPADAHKETPQDAPAPVTAWRDVTAVPAPPVIRGIFRSVQVNVDAQGRNIVGDAANEPSLAVSPVNPDLIAVGWRQFDTIASNFRQAGRAYSQDGGLSWTSPGVLQAGVFRSDPVLAADANGTFYYYSLKSDFSCQMFRSFNGGTGWSGACSAVGGDKAWMTIDRTSGVGRGNIYVEWSIAAGCCGERTFTRSTNGGASYMQPIAVPGSPFWGTLAVAPDGAVYVSGQNGNNLPMIARSSNAMYAAQTPVFEFDTLVDLGGLVAVSTGPNPGGLLGQVWVAADHSTGPTAGRIYLLASVDRPGADPLDVIFASSADRGATWTAPKRIYAEPFGLNAWQWFGTMSVAPNGRIDAVWNDTRNDPTATFSELYYAYSLDGGENWAAAQPLSPPFNHSLGYPNQNKLGDYYHMISDDWGANLIYAATFNGEEDVYFLRISVFDCNNNSVLDSSEIAAGSSLDCNGNGYPDECEADCNANGAADDCDIAQGLSADCSSDGVPDECQLLFNDCNSNALPDDCERTALIVQGPQSVGACPGETIQFHVTAAQPGVAYQWRRGGAAVTDGAGVSGATTATLTIVDVDENDAGSYVCDVIQGCLIAPSAAAQLSLLSAPEITGQPPSSRAACAGATVSLTVTAGGSPPLTYAWRRDGLPFGAPDSPLLVLLDVTRAQDGNYTCLVSNRCGAASSEATAVTVVGPEFTLQPRDRCGPVGATLVLSAAATADAGIYWGWRKDGTILPEADSSTLNLVGVAPADAGEYQAVAATYAPVTCIRSSDPAVVAVGDCPCSPGDLDADGDYDLADLSVFVRCFGPGGGLTQGCACANVDGDPAGNVDVLDWAALDSLISGPLP